MKRLGSLYNDSNGETVVRQLLVADGFVSRFVGLQFRSELNWGEALLLIPCSSVHTMFMRFPIDVAFIDKGGGVLRVVRDVRPWRPLVLSPKGTHATLEVSSGGLSIQRGDRLRLAGGSGPVGERIPKSVRFLLPRPIDGRSSGAREA